MKKILSVFIITVLIVICCGFKKSSKPYIVLSSGTITAETLQRIERIFVVKQRINYALIIPEGIKYSGVRMQISKQDDKTSNWGFSVIATKDLYIDMYEKYYTDYIYIQKPGHYIIQFFYLNKKNYPFAHKEFLVK